MKIIKKHVSLGRCCLQKYKKNGSEKDIWQHVYCRFRKLKYSIPVLRLPWKRSHTPAENFIKDPTSTLHQCEQGMVDQSTGFGSSPNSGSFYHSLHSFFCEMLIVTPQKDVLSIMQQSIYKTLSNVLAHSKPQIKDVHAKLR